MVAMSIGRKTNRAVVVATEEEEVVSAVAQDAAALVGRCEAHVYTKYYVLL